MSVQPIPIEINFTIIFYMQKILFGKKVAFLFTWQVQEIMCVLTVLASHSDRVLSAEQVSSVLENGRNSMELTESAWPRRVYRQRKLKEETNETNQ